MNNSKFSTAMIAKLAMMTAISLVLLFIVRLPWPPAPFLVYDPADVPIYLIDPSDDVKNITDRVKHIKKGASEGVKELIEMLNS
jgi:hypothetical protein